MNLALWRFIAIMATSLSMGLALCHLLEMPSKLTLDGAFWLGIQQNLYPVFGTVGAVFEVGAVLATLLLAFLVRDRQPAFRFTLAAALCMLVMHAIFWVLIAPVNAAIAPLTPETLPPDWSALRDRWEYSHAARAVLQMVALGALVLSVLREIPRGASAPRLRHDPYFGHR